MALRSSQKKEKTVNSECWGEYLWGWRKGTVSVGRCNPVERITGDFHSSHWPDQKLGGAAPVIRRGGGGST